MRRMAAVILVAFFVAVPLAWPASAQTDAEATVAALQTRVAELEATEARDGDPAPSVAPTSTPSPDLPDGIPPGAVPAEVADHIDCDKLRVQIGGTTEEVLLIGVDAPETDEGPLGECFAQQAGDRLRKMVPKGRTVYLEQDQEDRDSKDRLLRYVWFMGRDDDNAFLANEILLREGFGGYESRELEVSRGDALIAAARAAQDAEEGLWDECGSVHSRIEPTPEPTNPPEQGDAELPAPIGTTLTGGDVAVTLSSAFTSYEYGFATPKGGYVLLVVEAQIENVDDESHGYAGNRFSAKDFDSGAEFDDTFTLTDGGIGTGDLSPSEYVSGVVVLEVQETAQRIRIKYDTAAFGGESLYWLVEL